MEKTTQPPEQTDLKMPGAVIADPLSGLIQMHSRRYGLDIRFSGKGAEDMMTLILYASNALALNKRLWVGLQELWAMPKLQTLPEPVYAKICSIILASRINADICVAKRNQRILAGQGAAAPTPTDSGPARPL